MAVLTVRIIWTTNRWGPDDLEIFQGPSFSVVHNAAQNKNAAQTLQSMILPLLWYVFLHARPGLLLMFTLVPFSGLSLSQINKIIFGPVACLLVDTDRPP